MEAPVPTASPVSPAVSAPPLQGRSWWRWLDTEPGTRPSRAAQYTGWPASQAAIEAALREHAPIDGLLGFSQGATAAALYLAHAGTEEPRRQQGAAGCGWRDQLRFAVLIAGFLPRDPSYAAALQRGGQGPAVPSLHITGAADALVPAERSDALRACWRSSPADAWVHPGAHMVPTCSGEAKAVVAALLDGVKQAAAAGG